jgi:hypothetical protein
MFIKITACSTVTDSLAFNSQHFGTADVVSEIDSTLATTKNLWRKVLNPPITTFQHKTIIFIFIPRSCTSNTCGYSSLACLKMLLNRNSLAIIVVYDIEIRVHVIALPSNAISRAPD